MLARVCYKYNTKNRVSMMDHTPVLATDDMLELGALCLMVSGALGVLDTGIALVVPPDLLEAPSRALRRVLTLFRMVTSSVLTS